MSSAHNLEAVDLPGRLKTGAPIASVVVNFFFRWSQGPLYRRDMEDGLPHCLIVTEVGYTRSIGEAVLERQ